MTLGDLSLSLSLSLSLFLSQHPPPEGSKGPSWDVCGVCVCGGGCVWGVGCVGVCECSVCVCVVCVGVSLSFSMDILQQRAAKGHPDFVLTRAPTRLAHVASKHQASSKREENRGQGYGLSWSPCCLPRGLTWCLSCRVYHTGPRVRREPCNRKLAVGSAVGV